MSVFLFKRSLFVIPCNLHSSTSIWLLTFVHECFPCHYNAPLRTTSLVQWWHEKFVCMKFAGLQSCLSLVQGWHEKFVCMKFACLQSCFSLVQWWHGKDWGLHLHVLWSGKNEDGRERWHFSECQSSQKPKALHGLHSCEWLMKHAEHSTHCVHRHSVCSMPCGTNMDFCLALTLLYRTSMY